MQDENAAPVHWGQRLTDTIMSAALNGKFQAPIGSPSPVRDGSVSPLKVLSPSRRLSHGSPKRAKVKVFQEFTNSASPRRRIAASAESQVPKVAIRMMVRFVAASQRRKSQQVNGMLINSEFHIFIRYCDNIPNA